MRPVSSILMLVIASGAVATLVAAPPGQQAQAPSVFRAGIDLVQVDITVLDKQRRPVRGLKASDFTVVEDGTPQTVAAFSEVDVPDPPETPVVNGRPVTWMRDVAPDVQSNDLAAGRLLILLIDDALIPNDPRIVAHARLITQAAVDQLGPGDRMSVVFTEGSRQAQDFTSDRARLKAAVATMHPGRALYTFGWASIPPLSIQAYTDKTHNPHAGPDPDGPIRDGSFATLQMVSEALLSSPERRKALIYVSPGVPVNPMFAGNGNTDLGGGKGPGSMRALVNREAMARLADQMPDLFRRMQRANITVYAIDPIGPLGLENYIRDRISAIPQMREYSIGAFDPHTQEADALPCNNAFPANGLPPNTACFVPEAGDLAHVTATFARDFLETAAGNTGGRAVVGNEDFIPAIEQVFVENGSYYLLGYRAPPGNKPGDLHRLTVTVNRPGVDVRTRSGYYTPAPEKIDPKKKEISPASKAVAGVLANPDLPLQSALMPFVDPVRQEPVVLVVIGLKATTLDKPMSDIVEVQTRAFTPEGDARGSQMQQARIALRPSAFSDVVRYEALSSIALKPGRYRLRIGAYSALLDTAGSVFADVEVPDFAKDAVSLSGVMVTAAPPVPASPVEVFAKIVPVVPTAARTFQKLDRVSAFVRVYTGGASRGADGSEVSATVRARITNDRGEFVLDKKDDLGPSRFTGTPRAADFQLDLPIVTLLRGPYLLTIEAERGAARASRDVRFVVR